jgi:hypothetical protein
MNLVDSFRAARWLRLINLVLQAVLCLSLFAGLNYLSVNHAWRQDLTRTRRHSLSPETLSYLERLERNVEIVVTLTEDSNSEEVVQAFRDLRSLLGEYRYATEARSAGRGRIKVEYLDVYQRRKEAEARGIDQPNLVVLVCGERRRALTMRDLYETRTVGNQIRRESFLGESVLTAAILDVSSPTKKKIYFLSGHGETSPDDVSPAGLSLLRDELRKRDFALDALDLTIVRQVPEDATLLIAVAPQGRFQPFEEELLRQYLANRAGRLILLFKPRIERTGLQNLLLDWGVLVHDNLIYDTSADYLSETGDLVLRWVDGTHPITQFLFKNLLKVVVGPARVVMPDPGRTLEDGLNVRALIATGPTAWGRTNYRQRPAGGYEPGVDLRDTKQGLSVLVVSERVKPAKLALTVPGGRLAVFGAGDLVTNAAGRIDNAGNFNLFLNTINWAVDRDNQLNIPARPVQRFQLALSQTEFTRLRLGLLVVVPGAAALLGLLVYWARRT